MKKIIITSLLSTFLMGCSIPKATPYPTDSIKENKVNHIFLKNDISKVPLNKFDSKNWKYFIHGEESAILADSTIAKFWYIAHHSNKITLEGEQKRIEDLKLYLIANGTTKNIYLKPVCSSSKYKKCESKSLSILFEKEACL
ncbi:cag pathogenicity island Cag12 family protein [Pasteurella atlantica]|uniref:cag pathogenicity island Cag12 family protein n=1 Tax=Phocoenobacter atlanticus TaxID=3416742 RepID=UPI002776100A|nr:cag pathogenicity island Cag12 family protein [Pasteurella atlantica]MDP8042527.1 cag pathogenicity island Cag12 family protein [Pasteurella atlantica]